MQTSSNSTSHVSNYRVATLGSLDLPTTGRSKGNIGLTLGAPAKRLSLAFAAIAGIWVGVGCAKPPVGVPDVVNQDLDQAKKTLAAVPLQVSINGPQGTGAYVTQQSIPAGQQVTANSVVTLTVAEPVVVPHLVGSSVTDAVSTLQGLGLRVGFLSKHTLNPFAKTKVEAQNPPENTPVHRETVVTLNISGPGDLDALISVVMNEPGYKNLNPKYKTFLDAFLNNPGVARSMEPQDAPSAPSSPSVPNN